MYDDRTYDNLMDEMMGSFGRNVNTDAGSLAFNACAKIAEKLEDVYADMEMIAENMSPDTMDIDHLITYGRTQRGISYIYATAPIVKGEFKQEIGLGQQLICNDYTYTVTELIDGFCYKMVCETTGVEANTNYGDLLPLDYIDDYQGGKIVEILSPGIDDEDIEVFRTRILASFQHQAFAGNKADYRQRVDELDGVGGCKVKRREKDSPWIYITIISDDFSVPGQQTVTAVQTAVDPEQSHGEGDGFASIAHNVLIIPVTAVPVQVSVEITWEIGYSEETSKSQIDAAVQGYLLKLRQDWEKNEFNDLYVRISQIEARILSVDGIADTANMSLNGAAENLILKYNEIPIFGGVAIV